MLNFDSTATLHPVSRQAFSDRGHSNFTFESFVQGPSNDFAFQAARAVSHPNQPAPNPIFIFGSTGTGKTHLLNAISNEVGLWGGRRLRLVTGEQFLKDCISAIMQKRMHEFRRQFRDECDILLIDDLQVIRNGQAVQEELVHILNSFLESGKSVVVTSDKPPAEIKGLQERILSRFEGGLVVEIGNPDSTLRRNIIHRKCFERELQVCPEVVELLAKHCLGSIRSLIGHINKIEMYQKLNSRLLTKEEALRLTGILEFDSSRRDSDHIIDRVALHFSVSSAAIKGSSRARNLSAPRGAAMLLLRELGNKSLAEVGKILGGRDHTTVLAGVRRAEKLMSTDESFARRIQTLRSTLG